MSHDQPYPIPANVCLLPRLDITPQLPLPRTLTANQVLPRADLDAAFASLASKPALMDAVANILAKTDVLRILQPRTAQEPFMKMPDPTNPVYSRMALRHPNLFNYFGKRVEAPAEPPPPAVEKKAPPAAKSKDLKSKEKAPKAEAPPPAPAPAPPAPPKPEPPPVTVENGLKVPDVKKKPQPRIPTAIIDPSLDAAHRAAALQSARARLEQLIRSLLEESGGEDHSHRDSTPTLTSGGLKSKYRISMEGVKQICEELLGAKSSGLIPQLPLPLVKDLLQALTFQCYKGRAELDYDNDPSKNLRACTSLDAATSALYILSSQGMPTEVYIEEVIDCLVLTLKHHLQHNVSAYLRPLHSLLFVSSVPVFLSRLIEPHLTCHCHPSPLWVYQVMVFFDKRLARQWRPSLLKEGQGQGQVGSDSKGKGKGSRASSVTDRQVPKHIPLILGRLEQAMQLLSETLALVQVGSQLIMPLLRVAMQALTVEALHVFQVKVCTLSAASFRHQPGIRGAVLDELITSVLPTLQPLGAKTVPRHYLIQSVQGRVGVDGLGFTRGAAGGVVPIQMCVSLLLQLVQSAAELPSSSLFSSSSSSLSSPGINGVRAAYEKSKAPTIWADRFWVCLMDKLPTARATKADTSMDLKSFFEGIIQDLLAVSCLPEWPAAPLLIRRLVAQLNSERGLRHSEGPVRLMCVDFLGHIASRLVLDVKEAGQEEEMVYGLLKKGLRAIQGKKDGGLDDEDEEEGQGRGMDPMAIDDEEDEDEEGGAGKRRRRGHKGEVRDKKDKKRKVEIIWPIEATEVFQQLLISFLSQKQSPSSTPSALMESASSLIASLMLCDRLGEEVKAKKLNLMVPPPLPNHAGGRNPPESLGPSEAEADNQRRAEELIVLYRSLLSSPTMGRILTPPTLSTPQGFTSHPSPALELSSQPQSKKGRGKGQSSFEAAHSHPPPSQPLPSITREEAAAICRWLMANSSLGKRRGMLLKWLVEAGDKTKQDGGAANVRAKAIKCIGAAIDVDVRILGLPDVQGAVKTALRDDSVMVREAAVEVLGRYISRSKELAADYFDVIKEATMDDGLSVRKRAVKVLWECCILCPGFPPDRIIEAVVLILSRAGDAEESMRKLAASLCTELWFNPGSAVAEDILGSSASDTNANVDRSLRSRARQFSQVCLLTHVNSGGLPSTLPSPTNPMFALIKTILLPDGIHGPSNVEGSPSVVMTGVQLAARNGAKELANALVDWYLELHDAAVMDLRGSELQQLNCLLALHIITSVDASLCMPQSDPAKFIRCLAPYLKERQFDQSPCPSPSGGSLSSLPQPSASEASTAPQAPSSETIDMDRKRSAGRVLCIMHLITAVSKRLEHLDADLCDAAGRELTLIAVRHQFIGPTAGACQCLSTLVRLRPSLGVRVQDIATRNYRALERELLAGSIHTSKSRSHFPRLLIVLGHISRHGAEVIDGVGEQMHSSDQPRSSRVSGGSELTGLGSTLSSQPPTVTQILTLLMNVYHLPYDSEDPMSSKLRETALQAIGLLLIARPDLILDHPGVMSLFEAALDPKSPHEVKRRALVNLTDLLKAEEEGMFERQALANHAMSKRNHASILPAAALAAKPLARINGEGDSGSATSGVVQRLWKKVLMLTREVSIGAPLVSSQEERMDGGSMVRGRVLDLIEVVQRGGLTAPWQAVAPLVTLALDPTPETSLSSIKVLKQCGEKHLEFVGGEIYPGLIQAYGLQRNLFHASHPTLRFGSQLLPPSVQRHLEYLWTSAVQPHASLKQKFLSALARPFEEASNTAGPGALSSDLGLLWFLSWTACHVPYKKMDEPLSVLSSIGSLIARRAEACMVELKDSIEEEEIKRQGAPTEAYPVSDRLAGAVKANIAMSLLYITRQYIRQAYKLTDESRLAAYSGNHFLAFNPTSSAMGEGEVEGEGEGASSPAPPSYLHAAPALMSQSQAKKQELKNQAVKDPKVEPPTNLTEINLDAIASLSSSLKAASETYKTVKYLMKEDVRLLTATGSSYEGGGGEGKGKGQPLSTPVTAGFGGAKAQRGRPRTASTASARSTKMTGKGKRKKDVSDDDDDDEGDEDGDEEMGEAAPGPGGPSNSRQGSRASTRTRIRAPRTN